jgi:signal transduction histidine kinase
MQVDAGKRLQSLMTLGWDVAAALSVDEAFQAVMRAAMEITRPSVVGLWAVDEAKGALTLTAVSDDAAYADFPLRTMALDQGLLGEVARTRQTIRVPDVFADPRIGFADWHRRHGLHSFDAVPIVFEESILGILVCSRPVPFADGDDTTAVLEFFVDQAAIAIRNAKRLETLLEVSRQLASIHSVDALLANIAEACGRLLDSDSVTFRLIEGEEMPLIATWGEGANMALRARIGRGESLSGVVATTGQPLNLANALDDPRTLPAHREEMERHGYRAWLGVPVKVGDRMLGVLAMRTHRDEGFSSADVSVASAFASQAAVALDNAQLAADRADKTQRLEVLHRLTLGLTATRGGQVAFTAVARAAIELFGDIGCSLWLLDRETDELSLVADEGIRFPELRKTRQMKVGQGMMGRVVAERRPVVLDDIQERGHNQALSQAEGFRAAMAVPLIFGGECFGGLSVRRRGVHPFRTEDVDLLTALAGHAAITIEHARLYDHLREQADALRAKNEELDSFAYAVSHDLKAPLVSLQGMAGLLVEECGEQLGEDGRHYLSRIEGTVKQMETLIGDVLTLSRIGREGRPTEEVSLDDVVDVVLDRLAEPMRVRGMSVKRGTLGTVQAIRTQTEQVFANLIGNALKYIGDTPEPFVEIGTLARDGRIEYYVRDNGIGIAPEYHARIFETFQRLKDVEVEGSGIGLAIVKKIIDAAGGELRVESAVGEGSTFFFTWPAPSTS